MEDGSVVPSGVPISKKGRPSEEHRSMFGLFRGVVIRTVYPDESSTGERIEYIVKVGGQKYPNAITMKDLAGGAIFNFRETILKESEKSFSKEFSDATYDENLDGEIIYVLFLEGHGNVPIIVGTETHPKRPAYKAFKKDDGRFDHQEFNGIEFSVDKDSNYTIKHVGRKDPEGKVLNEAAVGSQVKLFGNGDYEINPYGTDGTADLRAKFTKADKKFELYAQDNKVIVDETGIHIEDKFGNIIKLEDGNVTVNSKGDVTMNADGDYNKTVGGDETESITGDKNITATGDVNIDGANVNITTAGKAKVEGTGGTDLGSGASPTNVLGAVVNLAGGGAPVARLGDMVTATGNMGAPAIGSIAQGSPKVTSG